VQISRRDLFRTSAAVAGVAALSGLGAGLAETAVAGTARRAAPTELLGTTTRASVLTKGAAGAGGYRPIITAAGEKSTVRATLGAKAKKGRAKRRTPLVAFGQLSDVHICDSESPDRVENGEAFSSSAYRPNEILGLHVANAMVEQLNAVGAGPITARPLDFVLETGDNSDNCQYNEVRWNIDVLDGGTVQQNSGDLAKYEGVMRSDDPDRYYAAPYWHPEGTPEGRTPDDYLTTYGFPTIPGLLDASQAPFEAAGLDVPWYSAMGNHDHLVAGNEAPDAGSQAKAVGSTKTFDVTRPPRPVTPDPDRRHLSIGEFVEEHFTTTGLPVGHGFTEDNRADGTAYYTFDHGDLIRFVVMDTTNQNGDDKGALNQTQLAWVKKVLASSKDKLVIFASHHPSWSMKSNLTGDIDPGPRIHGDKLLKVMLKHDNVIAWVNGHTHSNNIRPHEKTKKITKGKKKGKKKVVGGFWEINTASHIDWPQQARLIELTDNGDGTLSFFTTMLDHASPTSYSDLDSPLELAALARELAANDPQERSRQRSGNPQDRNTELIVKAPKFLKRK
jgi:metallophosphoesterase (TIGR03767 family)